MWLHCKTTTVSTSPFLLQLVKHENGGGENPICMTRPKINTATKKWHTDIANLLTAESEFCGDITNFLVFSDSKTLKLSTSVLNRYCISWYRLVFCHQEKEQWFFT